MNRLLLLLLFCSGFVQGQIVYIPDPNFKGMLLNASPGTYNAYDSNGIQITIDTNDDNEIQVSEALTVYELRNLGEGVNSYIGIQSFANLRSLQTYYSPATTLDLSGLSNFKALYVTDIPLTSMNFSGTAIETISMGSMTLPSMDFSNLPTLKYLGVDNSDLQSINVSGCSALEELYLGNNQLTSLDLSGLTALKNINVQNNNLSVLNLNNQTVLEIFDGNQNNLQTLDFSQCPSLTTITAINNQLTSVSFLGCGALKDIDVSNNPALSIVNLDGCTGLAKLSANSTGLTQLDVSGKIALTQLSCVNSELSTINLSGCNALEILYIGGNHLTSVDVSGCTAMKSIIANDNNLTALDVSNATGILEVFASGNQLSTMNLSDCTNLDTVNLAGNPLITLFIKNGHEDYLNINCPTLQYICLDDSEATYVQQTLDYYNIENVVLNSYCNFNPGGAYNTITGFARFDADENGCSITDTGLSNLKVLIDDGTIQGSTFVDAAGAYSFFVQQGEVTLTPSFENPSYFTISPASTTVSFPDNNYHTEIRDFCVTANGIHPDVEMVIIPVIPARPGFDAVYDITYKNKGNQTLSGNVNFNFDDAVLDFVSASVTPDTQTTDNLDWNYTNLLPFETRTITIILNVNSPTETPPVNINDVLNFTATVNPVSGDETPIDNVFGLKQTVVGSFDPNDKTCLQGSIVSPTQIGNYLFYVINFENTGTASAENVVIKDLIDSSKFDIDSFQMLGHSHNVVPVITGDKLEFFFENIDLSPNEYGYVGYKIKTKNNLPVGSTVTNTANIYFDFNAPVVTNTASTTFQNLGVSENTFDATARVFPNPANDMVYIQSEAAIQSVDIFDVQGRMIINKKANENNVAYDIAAFAPGIYYLRIATDKGIVTRKLIKE